MLTLDCIFSQPLSKMIFSKAFSLPASITKWINQLKAVTVGIILRLLTIYRLQFLSDYELNVLSPELSFK